MTIKRFNTDILLFSIRLIFVGLAFGFIVLLGDGCASTGSPSGGLKDVSPPKMDSLRSAENKKINFRPKQLEFFFDEFIEVRDPIKEVLVSPPLTYIPQVKHRGKKVTFAFDEKEVLRENATYTINFGKSIVDFHEGNELTNFNYVFATGPALDSMTFKGKIVDALTGEPDPEMVVFLYDIMSDSIVTKEKPFYFARPDKSGAFIFQNVKSDTFRLLAIKDENINYKYDLPTEKVAFYDNLIFLQDSANYDITLTSSLPRPKLKILSFDTKTYGKVNILYNTQPPSPPVCSIPHEGINHSSEISGDSVNVYYETNLDSFSVIIYGDTLKVKPKGKQEFIKKNKLRLVGSNTGAKVLPSDSIVLTFNLPVVWNTDKPINVSDTIGQLENVNISYTSDKKSMVLKYPWVAGEEYQISIDSNTIQSFYGHAGDSLGLEFTILKPEQTASINFTISDLDSTANYIITIQKEKSVVHTTLVSKKSKTNIKLKGLVPDRYNVEIIQDINNNGSWDPASYWTKTQPEPYRFIKGETVRENKETDINISWKASNNTQNKTENQRLNSPPLNIKK